MSHVIGQFDDLLIAEATTHRTPLVGKTLLESKLRERAGAIVVGVWERGRFEPARPETEIHENTVLVLAGSKEHLDRYNKLFRDYSVATAPVVILGGNRVGRATARALTRRGVDYRISEHRLHTDVDNVILNYVFRPGESTFPPFFDQALIARLAAEFCLPLTESSSRAEVLFRLAEEEFRRAKTIDSQQKTTCGFEDFSLTEGRR